MSGRLRAGLMLLGVLLVVGFTIWQFYDPGADFEQQGVDVSHHQGAIDWEALAADNTSFAFIKATEGGDWIDPMFAANWEQAAQAGVVRGAYHFFTLCRPGIDQANNLISQVPVEAGMLPPAVDLEFGGNCAARPSVGDFRNELDSFLEAAEAHYGTTLIAYVAKDFYEAYLADDPPEVIWWVRTLGWQPGGEPEWTFWQYFVGEKDGVSGRVDRNVFVGSFDELLALRLRAE